MSSTRDPLRLIDLEVPSDHEATETPRSRQFPQKRAEIIAAALRLADREGIEAVSMRRVAAELDIGTMTLYSYVEKKADLFALMADAIGQEVLLDEVPADWREALRAIARQSRESMLRHAWLMRVDVGSFISASFLRHFDQSLQAVSGLDADLPTKMAILKAVDAYTFGTVMDDVTEEEGEPSSFDTAFIERLARREGLDHLLAALPAFGQHVSPFERGLEWLLAGIEASLSVDAAPRSRSGRPTTKRQA